MPASRVMFILGLAASGLSVYYRNEATAECCKSTFVQANGERDVLVQKLLALLRSEKSMYVRLGDDTAEWDTMGVLCNSTTEAQLHSSAAVLLSHVNNAGNAQCTAARVQVLQLLRHLPHLKRLNISAEGDFIGKQEAAALSDTLRHSTLQVLCYARTAHLYAGFLAC